jgi:hypothetical protein
VRPYTNTYGGHETHEHGLARHCVTRIALGTWRMSGRPDWLEQHASQPSRLLWEAGMDVHDDCGNEGSHGVGAQQRASG